MRLGISRKRKRSKILSVFIVLLIIALIALCGIRLHNVFSATAHAYANNIATTAISNAAYEVFSKADGAYSNITNHKNAMLFETNTSKLNLINSKIASLIQDEILTGEYSTVYVPLGSVLGIAAFSGFGPRLPLKVHPISLVNTDFKETFDSCGINQVRHSVSLEVEIKMAYSGYLFNENEIVEVSVPVTDTVIVGNVPEYYGVGGMIAADKETAE